MEHPPLSIQLLGTFQVRAGVTPLHTLHAPRLQALLAYLLLHRDAPQPRRRIAFALWPTSTETQALTNLRNLVHQLRHLLPHSEECLEHDGPTLRWRADARFRLDVADYEQALARAEQCAHQAQPEPARAALEAAVATYGGDLLPGCYDEWILPERERLRQRYLGALERLVVVLEGLRDYQAAIAYTQQLVQAEPLHESAYLRLMRLHALSGDRAAALQVYQACVDTLQRELAVAPGQLLREAYERLCDQAGPTPASESRSERLPLVGRRAEWRRLLQGWQAAAAGHPQLLALSGEAGIGKTHLAEELLRWAARQGFVTARAQCYATEGELAYQPIAAWLRAPEIGRALTTLEPPWLREVARLVPDALAGRPEVPPPGPLAEAWQRQRFSAALRHALLAAGQPLALLLDDLHWCDRASLTLLRSLLHDDARDQILILATLRPDELDRDAPAMALLGDLRARDRATVIEVPPLDRAETQALAAHVAGRALDSDEGAAIYRVTEGNPLFIVETLRAGYHDAHARAYGAADAVGPAPAAPLPARVQAVIAWRLGRLSAMAHELAGVAAVIGRAFDVPLLAAVAHGHHEEALLHGLDELLQRRILREAPHGALDFSHSRLREVAYEQLSGARRRALHRRVAEALEQRPGLTGGAGDAEAAAHYADAGCPARAIRAYLRAAAASSIAYAPSATVDACRRGLTLLAEGARQDLEPHQAGALAAELEMRLGDGLTRLEQHAEARAAYTRALTVSAPDDALARARLQGLIGNSWRAQAAFDEAEQAYALALAMLEQRGPDGDASAFWRAWLDIQLDRLEAALWRGPIGGDLAAQRARMEELLERYGTPFQQARSVRCMLSESCWRQHSWMDDNLVARAEQMLLLNEATGDPSLITQARWLTGAVRLMHGDLEAAEIHLSAALASAERAGDLHMQAYGQAMLGFLARRREQVEPCRRSAERTIALAGPYQFRDCLGMAYADMAWLAWRAEERAQARAYGRQALDAWQHTPIVYPFQWTARLPLLAVALAEHDAAAAIAEAQALRHPLQQQLPAEIEAALSAAVAAAAQGRLDAAGGQLRHALELAQKLGLL